MYIDSIEDDEEIEDARKLYLYLKNNEEGLLDYRVQERVCRIVRRDLFTAISAQWRTTTP